MFDSLIAFAANTVSGDASINLISGEYNIRGLNADIDHTGIFLPTMAFINKR